MEDDRIKRLKRQIEQLESDNVRHVEESQNVIMQMNKLKEDFQEEKNQFEKLIEIKQEEIRELGQELDEIKGRNYEQRLEEIQRENQVVQNQLISERGLKKRLENRVDELNGKIDQLQKEIIELEDKIRELREDGGNSKDGLIQLRQENEELRRLFEESEQKWLSQESLLRNQIEQQLQQIKEIQKREQYQREQKEELERVMAQSERMNQEKEKDCHQMRQEMEEKRKKEMELNGRIQKMEKEKKEMMEKLYVYRNIEKELALRDQWIEKLKGENSQLRKEMERFNLDRQQSELQKQQERVENIQKSKQMTAKLEQLQQQNSSLEKSNVILAKQRDQLDRDLRETKQRLEKETEKSVQILKRNEKLEKMRRNLKSQNEDQEMRVRNLEMILKELTEKYQQNCKFLRQREKELIKRETKVRLHKENFPTMRKSFLVQSQLPKPKSIGVKKFSIKNQFFKNLDSTYVQFNLIMKVQESLETENFSQNNFAVKKIKFLVQVMHLYLNPIKLKRETFWKIKNHQNEINSEYASKIMLLLSRKYKKNISENFFTEQIKNFVVKNSITDEKLLALLKTASIEITEKDHQREQISLREKMIKTYLAIEIYYPLQILFNRQKDQYNRRFFLNLKKYINWIRLQRKIQIFKKFGENLEKIFRVEKQKTLKVLQLYRKNRNEELVQFLRFFCEKKIQIQKFDFFRKIEKKKTQKLLLYVLRDVFSKYKEKILKEICKKRKFNFETMTEDDKEEMKFQLKVLMKKLVKKQRFCYQKLREKKIRRITFQSDEGVFGKKVNFEKFEKLEKIFRKQKFLSFEAIQIASVSIQILEIQDETHLIEKEDVEEIGQSGFNGRYFQRLSTTNSLFKDDLRKSYVSGFPQKRKERESVISQTMRQSTLQYPRVRDYKIVTKTNNNSPTSQKSSQDLRLSTILNERMTRKNERPTMMGKSLQNFFKPQKTLQSVVLDNSMKDSRVSAFFRNKKLDTSIHSYTPEKIEKNVLDQKKTIRPRKLMGRIQRQLIQFIMKVQRNFSELIKQYSNQIEKIESKYDVYFPMGKMTNLKKASRILGLPVNSPVSEIIKQYKQQINFIHPGNVNIKNSYKNQDIIKQAYQSLLKDKANRFEELDEQDQEQMDILFREGVNIFEIDYFRLREQEIEEMKEEYELEQNRLNLKTIVYFCSVVLFGASFYFNNQIKTEQFSLYVLFFSLINSL